MQPSPNPNPAQILPGPLKQQLEQQLSQRRGVLQREIEAAQAATDPPVSGELVHDAKDDAERQQVNTVRDAEQARDWQELQRVQAALQRLHAGTYGLCADCASPIDPRRLAVEPASARCLVCQTRAEHGLRNI